MLTLGTSDRNPMKKSNEFRKVKYWGGAWKPREQCDRAPGPIGTGDGGLSIHLLSECLFHSFLSPKTGFLQFLPQPLWLYIFAVLKTDGVSFSVPDLQFLGKDLIGLEAHP